MYNKEDAKITKGLAILCMLCLHLFCRLGDDVFGTPLIWINEKTPLVYYIGFFCEICVPIYTLCAGYAQYRFLKLGQATLKKNASRIKKLLISYWVVLFLFSALGLIFDKEGKIPGSPLAFAKSIILLHSYNGAWWYLNTYILLMLIPAGLILFPVKKWKPLPAAALSLLVYVGWYALEKSGRMPAFESPVPAFIWKEIQNLVKVLPYYWMGALLCKENAFDRLQAVLGKYKHENLYLRLSGLAVFALTCAVNKSLIVFPTAVFVFLAFNLVKKPAWEKRVFLFLGDHSTNMWLTHMFFYAVLFTGLVQSVRYPAAMLAFMLALTIGSSYVIQFLQGFVEKIALPKQKGAGA